MTSDYIIVSIKLRPKNENDEYIFLSLSLVIVAWTI